MISGASQGPQPAALLPYLHEPALSWDISYEWGGARLKSPWARLGLSVKGDRLQVQVSSLWTQGPPPGPPPGALWGLWESEVVECFIVGAEGRYLELELGPFEHHLAISLSGVREPERWCLPVELRCERQRSSHGSLGAWRAEAELSLSALPQPLMIDDPERPDASAAAYRVNAFACVGPLGDMARRYLLASPLEGARPDFHQPERFPITLARSLKA